MNHLYTTISADVAQVSRLSVVSPILEVICKTTQMGFAAIARVTSEKWVACAVRDEIKFGLIAGGELKLDTTICHEIRQSGQEVAIDHVADDEFYATHHTPAMYGFQSYISVPLKRRKGDFWGTLCAIDPNPALLNTPEIVGMFKTYASLLSFHMDITAHYPPETAKELEDRTLVVIAEHLEALAAAELQTAVQPVPQTSRRPVNRRSQEFNNLISRSSDRISALIAELKQSAGQAV